MREECDCNSNWRIAVAGWAALAIMVMSCHVAEVVSDQEKTERMKINCAVGGMK